MCRSDPNPEDTVVLRPHHGLCLAYFIGNGYSETFSAHMESMLHLFLKNIPVRLKLSTDVICLACPNCREGNCISMEKVRQYDRAVLDLCYISEGTKLNFLDFAGIIQDKIILAGVRESICGDCQWNRICSTQKSRWDQRY